MKGIPFFTSCLLLLWACQAPPAGDVLAAGPTAPTPEVEVRVHLGRGLGPVPPALRPGFWVSANNGPGDYPRRLLERDVPVGAIELDIERAILASESLNDLSRRLAADAEFTEWAKLARAKGARLVISILKMPRWLATNPSGKKDALSDYPASSVSLPKDYALYERLVESIVTHFSQRLGVNAAYVVWSEPDTVLIWEGTDRDYVTLYRHAARAVKRVDPSAWVGGPAVSEFTSPKQPPEKATRPGPFLQNFLLAAGAERLPLDFVVWHEFNTLPTSYQWKVETVREWLRDSGYPPATPLWILEWNGWQQFDTKNPVYRWGSAERDTEVNAAHVISTLAGMHRAGIALHTFGTLEELDEGMFNSPSQFVGGFGALTRGYVVKATFNAFRMLGVLDGQVTAAETSDPFLAALASSTGERHAVLLSNFIPPDLMLKEDRERVLPVLGEDGAFLRRHGLSRELAQGIATGTIPLDDPRVPAQARSRLARFRDLVALHLLMARAAPDRRNAPVRVVVRWEGLDAGPWRLERFVIDAQHSNGFARRQEVEARLRRLGQDVRPEVGQLLLQEGATEAQLRELQRLMDQGVRRPALSGDLRRWADRAVELAREIPTERLDALNRAPGIGLDLVETRTLGSTESRDLVIEMSPNTVTLVILRR